MTDKYKQYLLSDEWSQLKIDLFNYRGRKCEKCGSTNKLAVHHIHYDNIFNEEPEDLIILCKKCHNKEHKNKIKSKVKKKKVKQKQTPKKKNKFNPHVKPKSRYKSKTTSLKYVELLDGTKIYK